MKKLMLSIIFAAVLLVCLQNVYGGLNKPGDTAVKTNQYRCPKHPQITDSWPSKCPICETRLACTQPLMQMMPGPQTREEAAAMNRRQYNIKAPAEGKCTSTVGDLGKSSEYSVGNSNGYVPYKGFNYGIYNYYPYYDIPYYGSYWNYGLRGDNPYFGYGLYYGHGPLFGYGPYYYGFGIFGGR
jgi:hypothetical protein